MDLYLKVRRAHFQDGLSGRRIARDFGISRDSVSKMLAYSEPPGYRRTAPVKRPRLDGFTDQIDQWLLEDKVRPRKQRHTAKRVFERLRDECGFSGGYTIVKDYVRSKKRGSREMFVPLSHPPGHAQADFGEALVVVASSGKPISLRLRLLHPGLPAANKPDIFLLAFDLPHSASRLLHPGPMAAAATIKKVDTEACRWTGQCRKRQVHAFGALEASGGRIYRLLPLKPVICAAAKSHQHPWPGTAMITQ